MSLRSAEIKPLFCDLFCSFRTFYSFASIPVMECTNGTRYLETCCEGTVAIGCFLCPRLDQCGDGFASSRRTEGRVKVKDRHCPTFQGRGTNPGDASPRGRARSLRTQCSYTRLRGPTASVLSADDQRDNWSWRSHDKTPFSGGREPLMLSVRMGSRLT